MGEAPLEINSAGPAPVLKTMLVIPAIDLKDHKVVRLKQGRMGKATVYSKDTVAVAKNWVKTGAKRIHVVDLNGAFEGKPVHFDEVARICKAFPKIEIEIGGGLRNFETVAQYFFAGASFCILGTAAIKDEPLILECCRKFPKKIILGIDAREGRVALEGWSERSAVKATDLAKKWGKKGIREIIYTDISRDGMMSGVNIEKIKQMASASPVPVIASGGVSSLDDIIKLKKMRNVSGVIVGKAIYEGKIDLKEAIKNAH